MIYEPVIRVSDGELAGVEAEALVLPVFSEPEPGPDEASIDAALEGLVTDMRRRKELRSTLGAVAVVPTFGRLASQRVALVGMGKRPECLPVHLRKAMSAACRHLAGRSLGRVLCSAAGLPWDEQTCVRELAAGVEMSAFSAGTYRRRRESEGDGPETTRLESVMIHVKTATGEAGLEEGVVLGRAYNLARELTHEPANVLHPVELARRTQSLAGEAGLQYEEWGPSEIAARGLGAVQAVTQGATDEPRVILLRHMPIEGEPPALALVGKAVTFDTGGISLKPSADMGRMKGDMAGGAAVIAAMWAIGRLGVPLNVLAIVPAAMNMPDGSAWRPGDVIRSLDGRTIETISTDAEGRMLLADGIALARSMGAQRIVDAATLTGACVVALGHAATGMFGTGDDLLDRVRRAGAAHGETHWPMPLLPEYLSAIQSDIADLKNSGGRTAGACTAAAFLREFAADTPWVHLDIAGTSHYEKATRWAPAGPTGVGVGTFIDLARDLAG